MRSRTATAGWRCTRCRCSSRRTSRRTPLRAGRAVGLPDHAAPGADREPAPRRGGRGRAPAFARSRRAAGPQRHAAGRRRASPSELILIVADLARSGVELDSAFVAELTRLLQGRGAALAHAAVAGSNSGSAAQDRSADADVRAKTAALQAEWRLSVANSIGSLRLVGAGDWPSFVESASAVERVLRDDPARRLRGDGLRIARRVTGTRSKRSRGAAGATRSRSRARPCRWRSRRPTRRGRTRDFREAHVGHCLVGSGRQRAGSARSACAAAWARRRCCAGTRSACRPDAGLRHRRGVVAPRPRHTCSPAHCRGGCGRCGWARWRSAPASWRWRWSTGWPRCWSRRG